MTLLYDHGRFERRELVSSYMGGKGKGDFCIGTWDIDDRMIAAGVLIFAPALLRGGQDGHFGNHFAAIVGSNLHDFFFQVHYNIQSS